MKKCGKCNGKGEYFVKQYDTVVFFCEKHAKEYIKENNLVFIPKIKEGESYE